MFYFVDIVKQLIWWFTEIAEGYIYIPIGDFNLRDIRHAVTNLPSDVFLPTLNSSGDASCDGNILGAANLLMLIPFLFYTRTV